MNRNQLKYFVAAAESRSFTKAAEQFYISQTAITQQMQLLEESLGCACLTALRALCRSLRQAKFFWARLAPYLTE